MTIKAFHPRTFGVMYPCQIIGTDEKNGTIRVYFPVDGKKYTLPSGHVSVDGVFQGE